MAVYIDTELCKSCKICISVCPKNVFAVSNNANKKGYNYMEAINEKDCITCKKCEISCPDFAIHVEK